MVGGHWQIFDCKTYVSLDLSIFKIKVKIKVHIVHQINSHRIERIAFYGILNLEGYLKPNPIYTY